MIYTERADGYLVAVRVKISLEVPPADAAERQDARSLTSLSLRAFLGMPNIVS
jgi:hypothetical protein